MTIGSHELALTIINDGAGYKHRCDIAKHARDPNLVGAVRFGTVSYNAHRWLAVAQAGAAAYERQFGSPGASCFMVEDILLAAVELAEYYEQHVAETEAVA